MAQKPNYNFQRAERDRAKKAKKEEKMLEKKLAAQREAQGSAPAEGDTPPSEGPEQ